MKTELKGLACIATCSPQQDSWDRTATLVLCYYYLLAEQAANTILFSICHSPDIFHEEGKTASSQ